MSRFLAGALRAVTPYTPGEQPRGVETLIKLNTNENPYPPSPKVLEALNGRAAENLRLYSDPACADFLAALAETFGVGRDQVFAGNGSDEVLAFAFLAFCEKGVAFADITYGFYPVFAQLFGIAAQEVPLREDFSVNTGDYAGAPGTVFLANPNAPTGLCLPLAEIEALLRQDPDRLVVVDEAYVDFGGESAACLLGRYDNLLVVGTFMDPTPAVLIFTPIFLPICQGFGMDPVQFGIMIVFNLCIGTITPPVGVILFTGCKVVGISIEGVIKTLLPFFAAIAVVLLLASAFVEQGPEEAGQMLPGGGRDMSWREMLCQKKFYGMCAMLLCGGLSGMMVISSASDMAQVEAGFSPAAAALMVSVLSLFNAGGRASAGILSDKLGRIGTLSLVFPISVAALCALFFFGQDSMAVFAVSIALVGKYTQLHDAYLSVVESLNHAGTANDAVVDIRWVDSETLTEASAAERLAGCSGILVPGGFGDRGIEGMIAAVRYARERCIPYFGICLGMQMAVIEFARHVLGWADASSSEFSSTAHPVIDLMPDQVNVTAKGGTMRLGRYPCVLAEGSRSRELYGAAEISERHRHRYEFNNDFRAEMQVGGMRLAGLSPDGRLVEIIELPDHPWFVGAQFHPEFKSRPDRPHPLFYGFIKASVEKIEAQEVTR